MNPDGAEAANLLDHRLFAGSQPHDVFDRLRAEDPVHRHAEPGGPGFWALTRYDDVVAAGRDADRFSSMPTIMIDDPDPNRTDPDHVMMLMADPPVHTRMRRLVSREFTPRAARQLVPRINELATAIVDEVIEQGECDLVADLAGEMPSFVIADILGIPLEDGRALYAHTETLHSSREEVGVDAQRNAYGQMFAYARDVYATKRSAPADDLATLLANGSIADDPIDETDFFLWFLLLVDAGGDTTRNLVGAGLQALFEHPAELDRLKAAVAAGDDAFVDSAIEELLRFCSPVIYMRRTATVDTAIRDTPIAAGEKVVVYYGAANRDPSVFDQPHRLDLGRAPNPHVAFGGGGPHFCLGAHLARLEIKALLGEIIRRLDALEPVGEAEWMVSNFIFGPTARPVRFRPGARLQWQAR